MGDLIWTGNFESAVENTLTHITVPGEQLTAVGTYAVVISAKFEGGEIGEVPVAAAELSATSWVNVKQPPVKVTINPLDSYSAAYDAYSAIVYTLASAGDNPTVEYTIQKSGEAAGDRKRAFNGTIPFTPAKPSDLKDVADGAGAGAKKYRCYNGKPQQVDKVRHHGRQLQAYCG